jgi:hypothetical protein
VGIFSLSGALLVQTFVVGSSAMGYTEGIFSLSDMLLVTRRVYSPCLT